jgi:predicted Rdx family selenoprotein
VRLADEIDRATGVRPRIRMGGLGALDVVVDGRVVFSKKREGRIPPAAEIVSRVTGGR